MQNIQELKNLQKACCDMIYQLENHQQAREPIVNLQAQISTLSNMAYFDKLEEIRQSLSLMMQAFCDSGLGKLNLMLANARVPKKYYDIFYEMLAKHTTGGGE